MITLSQDQALEFYLSCYNGEAVEVDSFPRLYARAVENLQMLTGWRLYDAPPCFRDVVSSAICAQVEFLALNGVESATVGTSGGGFTVGHVSVSGAPGGKSGASGGALGISPRARALLAPTGLLYRGVTTTC